MAVYADLLSSYIRSQKACFDHLVIFQLCDKLHQANRSEIVRISKNLDIDQNNVKQVFGRVAQHVLNDDMNWGRVAALIVWAREIATQHPVLTESVIEAINAFFEKPHVQDWIASNGGWSVSEQCSPNRRHQFCVIL